MQQNQPASTSGTSSGLNGSEVKISKTATSAHQAVDSAVDKTTAAVDSAVDKVKPMIGRVADTAHQAVDKAVSLAEAPAEWLSRKGEDLKVTQDKLLSDTRAYIVASPVKAVAIALVAGLLVGRFMR